MKKYQLVILLSAFCALLFGIRYTMAQNLLGLFLVWNLILAIIPFVFSSLLTQIKNHHHFILKIIKLGLLVCWLLFLPNAPYIITDLIHLKYRAPVPIWFDAIAIFSVGLSGLIIGTLSLIQVYESIHSHWKYLILIISCFASGFAVYLGRIERLNSWEMFTNTSYVLEIVEKAMHQDEAKLMTFSIGLLMLATHVIIFQNSTKTTMYYEKKKI